MGQRLVLEIADRQRGIAHGDNDIPALRIGRCTPQASGFDPGVFLQGGHRTIIGDCCVAFCFSLHSTMQMKRGNGLPLFQPIGEVQCRCKKRLKRMYPP